MARTILFLIDHWSSTHGGIQTFNRELCLALAPLSKDIGIKTVCVCTNVSATESQAAQHLGVDLRLADVVESDPNDSRILTNIFHSKLVDSEVLAVVGHAKFTGLAARNVRDRYFGAAKVVTTYHMDADDTEEFKEEYESLDQKEVQHFIEEWEKRIVIEREIALKADIVFAVGPKLQEAIESNISHAGVPRVCPLLCGIKENLSLAASYPAIPTFLFVGRTEHPRVKGIDLFATAAGKIVSLWDRTLRDSRPEPRFIIRGVSEGTIESFDGLKERAEAEAGRSVTIIPRMFSTDGSGLSVEVQTATVVVMPSRAEGYGLP